MEIKKDMKRHRDGLQQFIYKVINPAVGAMVKIGITPNMVTAIGFLGNLAAACLFVIAANNGYPHYGTMAWGGGVMIFFSLFDMLDGQVARLGNMSSKFGAMFDSVLDRYSELVTLGAISYMMLRTGYFVGAIITFVALVGSIMVSYVRARAEGLGIECKIGFMQRPERVVLTSVSALACGITGISLNPGASFDAMIILISAMGIIAVFANMTAFARLGHCRRKLVK